MEHVAEVKRIEEYKDAHGGKMPPVPLTTMLLRTFLPCIFGSAIKDTSELGGGHIKVGAAAINGGGNNATSTPTKSRSRARSRSNM